MPPAFPRPSRARPGRLTIPVVGTALLLIDVINDLAFEGSEALVAQAEPMSKRLASFKRRAARGRRAGRLRQRQLRPVAVGLPADRGALHGPVVSRPRGVAAPAADPKDYFVLKPMHSGFYGTTLDPLLSDLKIERVIVDRDRRQHLRPVHGQRRLHAGTPHLRSGGLHRVEHRRGQCLRSRADEVVLERDASEAVGIV